MSTVDDDRELEVLDPFHKIAYLAYKPLDARPWHQLTRAEKLAWARAADAVLDAYDPEWQHDKAGM